MDFNTKIIALRSKVYRFACSILDSRTEAEDVTQDVCEKLWRNRSRLDDIDNIDGFAISATRNLCLDRIRHFKHQTKYAATITPASELQPTHDTAEVLNTIIRNLPPKQQQILHLRDVEQIEFDTIAQIMEIDEAAVRMNLSRARKTVREKYIKIENYGL